MRAKVALAISILAFGLFLIIFDYCVKALGLSTYIDYGETINIVRGSGRYSYDEDVDGATTDVGIFVWIVSAMLAWRVYHWVTSGKIYGNLSIESHTCWLFWLIGMTSYIAVTTPIWQFDIPVILERIIAFIIGLAIAKYCHLKYERTIREYKKQVAKDFE